jgi:uncharacterized protein YqhQ
MTIAYIIFAIVLLHLIAGLAWALLKISKKPTHKTEKKV